jgi:hypothetical protein
MSKDDTAAFISVLGEFNSDIKAHNISLAIAIIANLPDCFFKLMRHVSSNICGALWSGLISASDRKEMKICRVLCSRIGNQLFDSDLSRRGQRTGSWPLTVQRRHQHHYHRDNVCYCFLTSFNSLCSSRGSSVCGPFINALISSI